MASDDSSDEDIRLRVGNIPLSWYDDVPFMGYDVHGRRVAKLSDGDALTSHINRAEDPEWWRVIIDHLNAKKVKISDELLTVIRKIRQRKNVGKDIDPYNDFDLTAPKQLHPISDAPAPKRRFVPSKWERIQVLKIARAYEQGLIKPKKEQVEEIWDLWTQETQEDRAAPHKVTLPGHTESYNPPSEYIFTPEEEREWLMKEPMNRELPYLPKKYSILRRVPVYEQQVKERFERCLDLFLAPRVTRPKINVDPESLLPELPNPEDFRPFPETIGMKYSGHTAVVLTMDFSPNAEYLASGDLSGILIIWETTTGKCMLTTQFKHKINCVAWNPVKPLLAVCSGKTVYVSTVQLLDLTHIPFQESEENKYVKWVHKEDKLKIKLRRSVKKAVWHGKGDFLATYCKRENLSKKVAIHSLSKFKTLHIFSKKSKGDIKSVSFHPKRPLFFVATEKNILTYNLKEQILVKKFKGINLPVHIHTHISGDHILAACEDKKLLWYDYDSATTPYRSFIFHKDSLCYVHTHRKFPLMASTARDFTVHIFHAQVHQDYMKAPTILPLKIIHTGSTPLICQFHPKQPWLAVTSGKEVILYV